MSETLCDLAVEYSIHLLVMDDRGHLEVISHHSQAAILLHILQHETCLREQHLGGFVDEEHVKCVVAFLHEAA